MVIEYLEGELFDYIVKRGRVRLCSFRIPQLLSLYLWLSDARGRGEAVLPADNLCCSVLSSVQDCAPRLKAREVNSLFSNTSESLLKYNL